MVKRYTVTKEFKVTMELEVVEPEEKVNPDGSVSKSDAIRMHVKGCLQTYEDLILEASTDRKRMESLLASFKEFCILDFLGIEFYPLKKP